jgi:protein ImuB
LRISEEIALTLREIGIATVGELMALPREGLVSRFGAELLLRLDQLTGAGREVIEPCRAQTPFQASYALEEPTGDRAVLIYVLKQLVDQLARQLAARDQGAVVLMCVLQLANYPPVSLRVGLLQPSANAGQLLELIELHLEATKLKIEVDRVDLRAAVVGRLGEQQRELFADHWSADPHQLAVLVNRLSSRLGAERVVRAELRESPVPERRVQWGGVMEKPKSKNRGSRTKSLQKENQSETQNPKSAIPLLLYPVPLAVEVMCALPDGPPQVVWHGGRREKVIECVGPERIETLWWRGTSVRRDYYRAVTQSGSHLWMFRRLVDEKWFLHGIFA